MATPYTSEQWQQIDRLGHWVEEQLKRLQVNLTMGGEPTFISLDDYQSSQWRIEALGQEKRKIAGQLLDRLIGRLAPQGGIRHYGLGKLYPGEDFPRWSLGYYWRQDGLPLWQDPRWLAADGGGESQGQEGAREFLKALTRQLGVRQEHILSAWEVESEAVAGYALPLLPVLRGNQLGWTTCPWQLEGHKLYLLPGNAPIGLRLPLHKLDWVETLETEADLPLTASPALASPQPWESPPNSLGVALCAAAREGSVRVFLPPLSSPRGFVDLIAALEATAAQLNLPVLLEGYPPPGNRGIGGFQITPDPGVLEVNIHPAAHWQELVQQTTILYEEARQCRLGTEKYLADGRPTGTGGGAHITIGGPTVPASPLLRRPDLLPSLIAYFQNHPSLSYLFAGLFVGPTSQSPRVDEARHESLYELEIAFQVLHGPHAVPPEMLDRLLRPLLADVTGNAHRTALCIDKLFPADNLRSQLGLLEFRAFAMPPEQGMRLLQLLLVRALVAWFWEKPYRQPLIRWGTALHDRFVFPFYLQADLEAVIRQLGEAGYAFDLDWFDPFFAFRFPTYGEVAVGDLHLELRHAIEPWPVLGEAANSGGACRPVDDSLERLQVKLSGAIGQSVNGDSFCSRYAVTCNGSPVPLKSTGKPGEYVGGVRFRARPTASLSHPAIAPHSPLAFEIVDCWQGRSLAGCDYYASSPSGKPYDSLPTNPQEAARRLAERFLVRGPAPGTIALPSLSLNPEYPLTLDLRRIPR